MISCFPNTEKMKLSIFKENDSVLLLGEGNFSFSVTLSQLNLKIDITATCYETRIDQETGKKNIEYLVKRGVRVILGVDATNLKKHSALRAVLFDKIIFNFPHVGGKMRIEKNRELLKQFFINAGKVMKSNGQVLVTLCNGQGGTCMDDPVRRWDDSWKITDMAAHGNFILAQVEPFACQFFSNYVVTGYRGLDKQFHSAQALTHFFTKSEPPDMQNIVPEKKIDIKCFKTDDLSWETIASQVMNQSKDNLTHLYSHTYVFDITLCVEKEFDTGEFYTVLYNYAGHIINNVDFIRSYMPPQEKERKTYRISYRSGFLPLYRKRVIYIHQNFIVNVLENNLNVTVVR